MAFKLTPPEPMASNPQSPAVRAWETIRYRKTLDPQIAALERKLTASMRGSLAQKRRHGEIVTVTVEQLMAKLRANDYRCALTGLSFWNDDADRFGPTIPSVDRLDPDGPYSNENTRVVLLGVNGLRGRGSDADMYRIARALVERVTLPNC